LLDAIKNIFKINLGVKKTERVLVFTDRINKTDTYDESDIDRREKLRCLAIFTAETGKTFCKQVLFHEYPELPGHGSEPPEEILELAFGKKTVDLLEKKHLLQPILNKKADSNILRQAEEIIFKNRKDAVNCIIALSNYSTSHTRFRDFITGICGCRYASMPLFEVSMLEGAMNVDWKALEIRTRKLAKIVNQAENVEIRTSNGTNLFLSKKGRKALADTGILTKKGAFSNLPAGEVFLAPVEGSSYGELIIEWAPTRQLKSPIKLKIEKGNVVQISGKDEYVEYLEKKFEENSLNRNIAELGIGTNNSAKRPDNILESEKILGTIHIALGDNSSFGGEISTPFHQDFVFFKPSVKLIYKDGSKKQILKNGELLI
jgi:leucyl aminopeptidase (aminopeptidase T)